MYFVQLYILQNHAKSVTNMYIKSVECKNFYVINSSNKTFFLNAWTDEVKIGK